MYYIVQEIIKIMEKFSVCSVQMHFFLNGFDSCFLESEDVEPADMGLDGYREAKAVLMCSSGYLARNRAIHW